MNAATVLITGALTGIGRATALAFARDGARIIVSGRRDEQSLDNYAGTFDTNVLQPRERAT